MTRPDRLPLAGVARHLALLGVLVTVSTCGGSEPTRPEVLGPVLAGAPLPPVASYTMITQGPVAKSILTVDGSASSDPNAGGGITNYAWSWGDGTAVQNTGTTPKAVHAYQAPGTFTLGLTVTNTASLTNTATQSITVAARDTFTFSYAPTTPAAGQAISFTPVNAAPPAGDTSRFQWSFSGKVATQYSSLAAPTGITYDSAGTWTVRVQRSYRSGPRQIITQPITIGPAIAPTGSVSCTPATVSNGTSVTCTPSLVANSGALSSYAWTETGGTPATGSTAGYSFTWSTGASLTPTLTAGNTYGKTGTFSFTLAQAAAASPVTAYTTSAYTQCAVKTTASTVYCWGVGNQGELGDNDGTMNRPTPFAQPANIALTTISMGQTSGCGLTAAGTAYCWGDNTYGEVGAASATTQFNNPTPVSTATVTTWSTIGVGNNFACGIAASPSGVLGKLYCWGRNDVGEVGTGSSKVASYNVPTLTSGARTYSALTVGNGFACAITSGATPGVGYCWGSSISGQIGNNTNGPAVTAPAAINNTNVATWTSISAGADHACGIDGTANKFMWCWGSAANGLLGDGQTTTNSLVPKKQTFVPSGTWAGVNAGQSASCAWTTTGAGYCWGANDNGQVGNGTTTTPQTTPSAIAGGISWASIDAGVAYGAACGKQVSTNMLYCWGANSFGLVGDGTSGTIISSPQGVALP